MAHRMSWYGLWVATLVGSTLGGCKCGRDVAVARLHLDDPSFNQFVTQTLEVCRRGDYDGFRQLFGSAYEPTSEAKFVKVWSNVKAIEVRRIVQGPQETPHYYVYARVRLREPDRKQQDERDIWVTVYRESGRWRLGVPSQEIIEQLRMLETAPADETVPPR